jgi:hypothetical protein
MCTSFLGLLTRERLVPIAFEDIRLHWIESPQKLTFTVTPARSIIVGRIHLDAFRALCGRLMS